MRDRKWDKIPKIFKYAAELHSKEALGLHEEIVRLKSENHRLQQTAKIQEDEREWFQQKALAQKSYNKVLIRTVDKLKSQSAIDK